MKNIVQEMHQPGKLCTGFNSIGHRNPIITEKSKGCNLMRVREFIRHKYVSIGCRIDNYPLTRRTIVAANATKRESHYHRPIFHSVLFHGNAEHSLSPPFSDQTNDNAS